jgi:hypothetical protein
MASNYGSCSCAGVFANLRRDIGYSAAFVMGNSLKIAVAIAAATVATSFALAQVLGPSKPNPGQPRITGGTSLDPSAKAAKPFKAASIPQPKTRIGPFTNARYAASGAALRNRLKAGFTLSGFVPPLQAQGGFLYWGILVPHPAPDHTFISQIIFEKEEPGPKVVQTLTGTLVGQGPDTCWGSDHLSVYRAQVPANMAVNGQFEVKLPSAVLNSSIAPITDFSDPFLEADATKLQYEGATLVLIGTGTATVNILDFGLAGTPRGFPPVAPFSYTMSLFGTPNPNVDTIWTSINADGQVGTSVSAVDNDYDEQVFINGVQVSGPNAGPNAHDTDSDFNGNDGNPLPQLWDTRTHDLTGAGVPGIVQSGQLNVTVSSLSGGPALDCTEVVANVVSF